MPTYQELVLPALKIVIDEELAELEKATANGPLPRLAWIARNLLELAIWTEYCCKSEDRAKRFYEDSSRDVIHLIQLDQAFSKDPAFSFSKARDQLIELAKKGGIPTVEEPFTKVKKAATELGLQKKYLAMNKVLSKFAHPTALRVIVPKEQSEPLRQRFAEGGKGWAKDALERIDSTSA